jgi:PadR family transcriptional regulator, regulatory protein PadR
MTLAVSQCSNRIRPFEWCLSSRSLTAERNKSTYVVLKISKRTRRASDQTLLVVESLLRDRQSWHYGYTLSQQTGLPSGTLYPILMRLESNGMLEAKWTEPERGGRPPRHLYRLSASGARWAREALSHWTLRSSKLQPSSGSAR